MKLHVGCGKTILPGWVNLDRVAGNGVDVGFDLEQCYQQPLPFADDSFDEFLMSHVLEHVSRPLPLMQELHRVAQPDAKLVVRIPYGSTDVAWEDPTHVRLYFLQSFGYFSQAAYGGADYGYRGDWRLTNRILVCFERYKKFENDLNTLMTIVMRDRNVVAEMIVEARAVKPIRTPAEAHEACPVQFAFEGE